MLVNVADQCRQHLHVPVAPTPSGIAEEDGTLAQYNITYRSV